VQTPPPRGPLSRWLINALRCGDPADLRQSAAPPALRAEPSGPAWLDEDLQLALWCCYELHYRGFEDADDRWEWHPAILGFLAGLERRWLAGLMVFSRPEPLLPGAVPQELTRLVRSSHGPDLAGFLSKNGTEHQFAELLAHKSIYQLKEADPHSFGLPRLGGAAKAALVEIQADEYGGGRPERMHAELFRSAMRWAGLCDEYGHYVPAVPAVTLAVSNLMSLFALHRRWLGALLGHLAALEMTSTGPNRRYSAAARRLGAGDDARRYFDEHILADAVHEQVAVHDLCGGYAAQHPAAAGDIMFGAACCLALDNELARHMLSCWEGGRLSLAAPLPAAATA
jgi:Iron-containing redox enzyme